MSSAPRYDELIVLPRAVRFPVEMIPPEHFDPAELDTWPAVNGRLEYVGGRLLFMPPCADEQQDTVADVVITLGSWVRAHPDFVIATNEAGMHLGGEIRAADVALWRRADLGRYQGRLRPVPPVLAVEVAGTDEGESALTEKADWYLRHGVSAVWVVLPDPREVVVCTDAGRSRHRGDAPLPAVEALPDLVVRPDELFVQLDAV